MSTTRALRSARPRPRAAEVPALPDDNLVRGARRPGHRAVEPGAAGPSPAAAVAGTRAAASPRADREDGDAGDTVGAGPVERARLGEPLADVRGARLLALDGERRPRRARVPGQV